MDLMSKEDRQPMDLDDYERFLGETIISVTDLRGRTFERSDFEAAVSDADGDYSGRKTYNHYVPYQALRVAIEQKILTSSNSTRLVVCKWLESSLIEMYNASNTIGISQLSPPTPKPSMSSIKDSLTATMEGQTRADMAAWQQWALEAVCDYPDNCYYGPGTGDAAGTKVDVPTGGNKDAQKLRLQAGAVRLRELLSPNLDKWVDGNGKPMA